MAFGAATPARKIRDNGFERYRGGGEGAAAPAGSTYAACKWGVSAPSSAVAIYSTRFSPLHARRCCGRARTFTQSAQNYV